MKEKTNIIRNITIIVFLAIVILFGACFFLYGNSLKLYNKQINNYNEVAEEYNKAVLESSVDNLEGFPKRVEKREIITNNPAWYFKLLLKRRSPKNIMSEADQISEEIGNYLGTYQ